MIRDRYLPVLASTGTKEERMTRAAVAVRNLRLSNPGICGAWHFLDRTTCMLLVTSATCMFLPLLCFSSLARWFFERRFSNSKDVHRMVYYIVWRGLQNHVVAGYNICFYDINLASEVKYFVFQWCRADNIVLDSWENNRSAFFGILP